MLKEQVSIVDDDSENMTGALGISDARAKEIYKKAKIFCIEEDTKTASMNTAITSMSLLMRYSSWAATQLRQVFPR